MMKLKLFTTVSVIALSLVSLTGAYASAGEEAYTEHGRKDWSRVVTVNNLNVGNILVSEIEIGGKLYLDAPKPVIDMLNNEIKHTFGPQDGRGVLGCLKAYTRNTWQEHGLGGVQELINRVKPFTPWYSDSDAKLPETTYENLLKLAINTPEPLFHQTMSRLYKVGQDPSWDLQETLRALRERQQDIVELNPLVEALRMLLEFGVEMHNAVEYLVVIAPNELMTRIGSAIVENARREVFTRELDTEDALVKSQLVLSLILHSFAEREQNRGQVELLLPEEPDALLEDSVYRVYFEHKKQWSDILERSQPFFSTVKTPIGRFKLVELLCRKREQFTPLAVSQVLPHLGQVGGDLDIVEFLDGISRFTQDKEFAEKLGLLFQLEVDYKSDAPGFLARDLEELETLVNLIKEVREEKISDYPGDWEFFRSVIWFPKKAFECWQNRDPSTSFEYMASLSRLLHKNDYRNS